MLAHLGPTLTLLANAWAAFSWLAAIVGLSGLGLVLAAGFGLALVPRRLRTPAIIAGAALIALASIWQAGEAKGAHDAYARDAARALAAEQDRAALADAQDRRDRAQVAQDLAAARADATRLKDLTDALALDPRRDGVCLPRDLSRRMRHL